MTDAVLRREEEFHDDWAASVDVHTIPVDQMFESCTAPEGRRIVEWLGDVRGRAFLDLGCGFGEAAVYFAKRGALATASDLSGRMLQVVNRLAAYHGVSVTTERCSADHMPFPDGSFDIVYAGNLLHHTDIAATLSEVRRILKTGGVGVFWDPLGHNPLINVYRRMASKVRTPDEHPLRIGQLALFRKCFQRVQFECFWLFTLCIFLRFFLIEAVNPNRERYWKKIIAEHRRLQPAYTVLEKLDALVLHLCPFLKRYCWNIAVRCEK